MNGKLKEKEGLLKELLDDPEIEPGDQFEFDITKAHVVVTMIPLATAAKIYPKRALQALNLIRQNREMINQEKLAETNAAEAIRANREERDEEIAP